MSHTLLFEIGVEELPSSYVPPALAQLERGARAALEAARLPFEHARATGTPRRLVLEVTGLEARQTDVDEEAVGPAVRVAYDAQGQPTRALLGFCQGKGADVAAVRRVATPKGEYVAVTVHHEGRPALDVLPALLAGLAGSLVFPKTMRWLDDDTRFARPVRWLVALLDGDVVPVRAFGLEAGRETPGHRFLSSGTVTLKHAEDHGKALEGAHVLANHLTRGAVMSEQVGRLAREAGGDIVADEELVEINTFLVEHPTAFAGTFDPEFLALPREVIITALREHQRYFAVEYDGKLLAMFIAVRDGDERGLDQVRKGNQDVLVARLQDARFYWETDLRRTPEEQVQALGDVVWMEGLGSLGDKAVRLESLARWIAARIAPEAAADAARAARLAKTDLLSEMIGSGKEYASLEGVIGGHYARRAGEPEAVAAAIAEHYRPRGGSDALPETPAGRVLSLADKLDHVAGAFIAGKAPSGSEDPYGVRRAANGVVRILIETAAPLDLRDATMEATRHLFAANPDLPHAEIVRKLGEFWRGRVETALEELGRIPYDIREAALEARVPLDGAGKSRPGWTDPWDAFERARSLGAMRADERFASLVVLFKRVANILAKATETLPASLDRARLHEPVEQVLLASLERARTATAPLWERRAYAEILPALLGMEQAIHGFFDGVMVNAEDPAIRHNRLRLLSEVRDLFVRGWDLSKVVVEGEKG